MEFDRASGIGGSDVAAILGLSPWRTAWDVWMEKTRDPAFVPQEETPAMRWGTAVEPILAADYTRRTGRTVTLHPPVVWDEHHVLYAHLDGLVDGPGDFDRVGHTDTGGDLWAAAQGVWEGKTASSDRDWRECIPPYYETQVRTYLALTRLPWCDITVKFPRDDPQDFRVERDEDIEDRMLARLYAWWDVHVRGGAPPPVDASEGAARYLSRTFPAPTTEELMPYGPEFDRLVRTLLDVRRDLARSQEAEAVLVNRAKMAMGEYPAAKGDGWSLSWKRTAGYDKTDWKLVASAYRKALAGVLTEGDLEAIESIYTDKTEGSRPFVLRAEEDK